MGQSSGVTLWKRAWRMQNGNVHSTRPYASEEDIIKDLEKDGHLEELPHGNAWCGEAFSFIADDFTLADFKRCEENARAKQGAQQLT